MYNWTKELPAEIVAEEAFPFLPSDPCILEAGCLDGTDTINFKRIWDSATIHAFEPNKKYYDRCVEYKKLPGITFVNKALSDRIGEAKFYRSELNEGASSLYLDNVPNIIVPDSVGATEEIKKEINDRGYRDVQEVVQTTTINKYFKNKRHPNFMWLDMEGAELRALQHGESVIPSVKVIMCEVNFIEFRKGTVLFPELNEFLTAKGFTLMSLSGNPEWQANAFYVRNP